LGNVFPGIFYRIFLQDNFTTTMCFREKNLYFSETVIISRENSLFQGKIPYFSGKSLISGENTLNSYPGM